MLLGVHSWERQTMLQGADDEVSYLKPASLYREAFHRNSASCGVRQSVTHG